MEYFKLGDLQNFIRLQHNYYLPSPLVVELALHIAKGLQFLHENKVIHRDLKPGNILIGGTRDHPIAKIGGMLVLFQT